MKPLRLEVVTPEATRLRAEQVEYVRMMLADGSISIFPGHAPLIGSLGSGEVKYQDRRGVHTIRIDEGILYVHGSTVTILTGELPVP